MRNSFSIKRIFLFISPLILAVVFICSINPSPKFKYYYLKNNCSAQSLWMYKKIYEDSLPVNAAFFGSSHTLLAINDSLLPGSANFAYCRFGRDIQYALFEEVLQYKKIKKVFFEITETEPSYSHPDYPFAAKSSDVFLPAFIYNQSFLKNRYDAFLFRLAYVRDCLFGKKISLKSTAKKYSFISHDASVSFEYLESQKSEKLKDLSGYNPNNFLRRGELSFSTFYLNKIKKLVNENNCEAYFLYLPAYGNDTKTSLDSAFYKPYFKIIVPPDSILNNYKNWSDEAHLNIMGANKISEWLLKNYFKD